MTVITINPLTSPHPAEVDQIPVGPYLDGGDNDGVNADVTRLKPIAAGMVPPQPLAPGASGCELAQQVVSWFVDAPARVETAIQELKEGTEKRPFTTAQQPNDCGSTNTMTTPAALARQYAVRKGALFLEVEILLSDDTRRWFFMLPDKEPPPSSEFGIMACVPTWPHTYDKDIWCRLKSEHSLLLDQVSTGHLSTPGDIENDELVSLDQPLLRLWLGPHGPMMVDDPFSDLRMTTLSPEAFRQLKGLIGGHCWYFARIGIDEQQCFEADMCAIDQDGYAFSATWGVYRVKMQPDDARCMRKNF